MNTVASLHIAPPSLQPSDTANETALRFSNRLSTLYHLSQKSDYVFGSPIGPFYHRSRHYHLPRFVYFGPHTHDESLRLAIIAGFDHTDLRGSLALTQLVEHLILTPDLGQGLNISIFPLVDVVGLQTGANNRGLASAHWALSQAPEISLLSKEARTRGYHGFVRVESGLGLDEIAVSLAGTDNAVGVELVSSEDIAPLPVRWEAGPQEEITAGPLGLADDLPFSPFDLTLKIPSAWPTDLYRIAVSSVLKRFVLRYRGLQAYGQGI